MYVYKVSTCMCSSILCEHECLDGELCKGEIEKCICKLKNSKTGGVILTVNGESKLKLK